MTPCRVLTTKDAEAWRAALPTDTSIMGSLDFLRIQERQLGLSARLFVSEEEGFRVAYPFFLRPVPGPGAVSEWDISTPEYTGPFLTLSPPGATGLPPQERLLGDFGAYCQSQGIIAEFGHLHPWNEGVGLLDPSLVEVNREIVYVDLSMKEEDLWRLATPNCRRQVRQARRAGVIVRRAETRGDVLAFHHLHRRTMERRSAQEHYFLPPEYLLEVFETLPRNAFFLLAEHQGEVVAGGLYFQDATDVYWYLSAMDMDHSSVRPVNAYHYESIRQTALAGKKRMILGGFHREGDGIFRFKAGFSPLRVPFRTYKRIHDSDRYASLTAEWSRLNGGLLPASGFFPAYRAARSPEPPPGGVEAAQEAPREALSLRPR
ncbi:GNAT family N-acetyltransferase [Geothrix oryzisoli]|uniref:GNAT family N-acetyltransferase n=1 Tax=Geothrix oryzisoli TaxID=2922721 RepID=UPI001FAC2001|nr:GNAT family N-acetyltransferase [Geothrix oryzisoli]